MTDQTDSCGDKKGTPAGYMRHQRAKERKCAACKKAWAIYYQKRKG